MTGGFSGPHFKHQLGTRISAYVCSPIPSQKIDCVNMLFTPFICEQSPDAFEGMLNEKEKKSFNLNL